MATTRFLSRLIGLAALILSVAMFADKAPMLGAIDLMSQDRAATFLLGLAGVVAGLAIVLTHNVWSRGAGPLVVTLCGWFILVRGVLLVVLPAEAIGAIVRAMHYPDYYYLYAVIPLVLGAYLTWCGFAAASPAPAAPKTAPAPPAAKPQPAGGARRPPQRRRR